tara:strand:+ start:2536 stop:3111 length:576 start_codon:yes stop_codon:yes gene_type:complete
MRKIMIIGAGGIGSFLVSFLDRIGLYDITIYDDDLVENKNLTYQNYGLVDVGDKKVDAIVRKSSNVTGEPYFVLVKEQLANYDLVVCCADNLAVRRLLYKEGHGEDIENKWLDLRSQGRNAALISYKTDPTLMDSMLEGPDGSFSCQGTDWEGEAEGIDAMHIAIAGAATQWIQKWFNDNDDVIDKMVMNI